MNYIACAEDESEESTELPLEADGTLAMSTLQAQYPGASGLKYRWDVISYHGTIHFVLLLSRTVVANKNEAKRHLSISLVGRRTQGVGEDYALRMEKSTKQTTIGERIST